MGDGGRGEEGGREKREREGVNEWFVDWTND